MNIIHVHVEVKQTHPHQLFTSSRGAHSHYNCIYRTLHDYEVLTEYINSDAFAQYVAIVIADITAVIQGTVYLSYISDCKRSVAIVSSITR